MKIINLKKILRLAISAFLLSIVAFNMAPLTAQAAGSWYDSGWGFRKEITIDAGQVAGSLSDFPVLIGLNSDAGLSASAQSDGDDILFTATDGTTKLSHEIEYYDSGTGKLLAWVKVPALSGTVDTSIYMYYGNAAAVSQQDATGVWDANFTLVQHLNETSGTEYDSTANDNDGAYTGAGQDATGIIDGADSFNGVNERVQIGHDASLSFTGSYTVEAWVNIATLPQWSKQIVAKDGEYFLQVHGDGVTGDIVFGVSGPGWLYSNTPPTQSTWVHVAGVFQRGANPWGPHTMQLYIDGLLDISEAKSGTPPTTTGNFYIGSAASGGYFNGSVDEVRLSNIARSPEWLLTSHANQSDPAAFYSVGAEETPVVAPTVTTGAATAVAETGATLNGTVNDDGGEASEFRFEYDTDSGEPYAYSTPWTGSLTSGQAFSLAVSGLDKGTKYYFRAQARNSAGTASGSELELLTRPDAPVDGSFTASVISSTQINLSWVKGEGAQRTMVRAKEGSYPTSVTDGREVYFDTGTSVADTGLTPSTTYYYRAWSEVTGSQQWSSTYVETSAATSSGSGSTPVPPSVTSVGGTVYSVDKIDLLLPWFGLAAVLTLLAVGGGICLKGIRRNTSLF